MRRIREGSGNGEMRREGGGKGQTLRARKQLDCVQMCRSAAGRRQSKSMLTGRSRHREDLRNERTGPRPFCTDRVQ